MYLNENRKEFIRRNEAEPKNWKQPFESEISGPIFKIVSIVFNFITASYLNILLLVIIISLLFKEWEIVIILSSIYIFIKLIRYGVRWFSKNYKNIKSSTTSENVTFIKLEKEESINDVMNESLPHSK